MCQWFSNTWFSHLAFKLISKCNLQKLYGLSWHWHQRNGGKCWVFNCSSHYDTYHCWYKLTLVFFKTLFRCLRDHSKNSQWCAYYQAQDCISLSAVFQSYHSPTRTNIVMKNICWAWAINRIFEIQLKKFTENKLELT